MDIKINELTKAYHYKTVLHVRRLAIPSGTFLGVIGPNGAGKSTLARIVAGLEHPDAGEVLYDHQGLNAAITRKITMVFQKPYMFRTTVFHNIASPLRFRGVSERSILERVHPLMEEMGILHIAHQNAWTLSGGEAQKVALARAIVFEPSLLILDEPTANIDPASIFVLENTLRGYYMRNKPTILLITHNLQQSKRLCSHSALMHHGEMIDYDTTEGIWCSNNPLTQKFIAGEIIL